MVVSGVREVEFLLGITFQLLLSSGFPTFLGGEGRVPSQRQHPSPDSTAKILKFDIKCRISSSIL